MKIKILKKFQSYNINDLIDIKNFNYNIQQIEFFKKIKFIEIICENEINNNVSNDNIEEEIQTQQKLKGRPKKNIN